MKFDIPVGPICCVEIMSNTMVQITEWCSTQTYEHIDCTLALLVDLTATCNQAISLTRCSTSCGVCQLCCLIFAAIASGAHGADTRIGDAQRATYCGLLAGEACLSLARVCVCWHSQTCLNKRSLRACVARPWSAGCRL